ncbi:MAG: HAD-IC family P-type ATPase [Candidatus Wildermuthbacteria bacterium]|nr:HAD-IC family P-type ATPase [Candidatus Wildermuthbacteria bacterium]
MEKMWHAVSWEEAVKKLGTDPTRGLSREQVKEHRHQYGRNVLPEEKIPSRTAVFLRQLKSPLIFILVLAGMVTIVLRDYTDSIVIWGAVLLNASIGYIQEYRATKALKELKKALKVKAKVIREGNEKEVFQEELVPGDIVLLEPGIKVPADARIIESWDVKVQEAALTGEWIASSKTNKILGPETPLADRENMAFMGSVVEEGGGKAVVVATGEQTEVGEIATLLKGIRDVQTPYQMRLAKFSHVIGRVIAVLAFLIFLEGVVLGRQFSEMFTVAVAIAVGAIPEGLPVAITAILAIGMQRMLKEGGLVRHLASTETLGSVSVIATDKTLTLTEGIMEVEEIWTLRPEQKDLALKAAALASEAFVENPEAVFEQWIIRGRPTDKALVKAALDAGISKPQLQKEMEEIRRIPFESERKFSASFYKVGQTIQGFLLGAPETIFAFSKLSVEERARCEKELQNLAGRGFRVVAVGETNHMQVAPQSSAFLGLIALKDPLRKGVKEAVRLAREAGIQTLIVTGDHALTAHAVGKELGISKEAIYARVEPADKMRIIEKWQAKGAIIAMTGDGINDAPALKKADIGIALGSGTDVAKESADLVLIGDKFSIIPQAIKEGRVMVDNIRKVITYMLSGSFTETILIGASLFFGLPLPVTASQILWVNLVEDGLPGIALTFEKGEKNVMQRRPEGKHIALLTSEMKVIIFAIGILTDLILLGLFWWLLEFSSYSLQHIRTVVFVGLALNSLLYVFSCRSLRRNIWSYNPLANKYLTSGVLIAMALLLLPVYFYPFQQLFHTVALSSQDWVILVSLAFLNVALIELVKWIFIKRNNGIVKA